MKQSFWNKALSYVKDVHIESASSLYNDELDVLLVKGEYQLVTPEAIYSYGNRYDNFFEAFKRINIKEHQIDNVLLLGLGLGSIPYMLERFYKMDCTYTAVEIDDAIIYLASKYVLNDLTSDITTVCTDAIHFVNVDQNKYDMVAMDVFVSDYIPDVFETEEFLRDMESCVADDGLVLFNRLYYFDKDKKKTKDYYERVFKKVFPRGRYLEINGNWILLNK